MSHPRLVLDILIATWAGGGTVPPAAEAALRLRCRGHRVRLMAEAVDESEALAAGVEFRPWRRATSRRDRLPSSDPLRDWEAASDLEGFARLRDRIMCGPALAYAEDVLEEVARRPVDIIVSSEMLLGVMAASERARVPLALLCPNISLFPLPGMPPMGMGLLPARSEAERLQQAEVATGFGRAMDEGLSALNAARRKIGLDPLAGVAAQVARAGRILLATSPAFDFPLDRLPRDVRYVGPLLAEPSWAESRAGGAAEFPTAPLVLVSFSTTFQDQLGAVRAVVAALAGLPVHGLVTLGPALADEKLELAPNVTVVESASHGDVMRRASVVVTHGGHGTVLRALKHGLPLLCLPMGRDQHDNAARVVARGAGLCLDRRAAPAEIRTSLQCLLEEDSFRSAALEIADGIASGRGTSDLVEEIEALAGEMRTCAKLETTY